MVLTLNSEQCYNYNLSQREKRVVTNLQSFKRWPNKIYIIIDLNNHCDKEKHVMGTYFLNLTMDNKHGIVAIVGCNNGSQTSIVQMTSLFSQPSNFNKFQQIFCLI